MWKKIILSVGLRIVAEVLLAHALRKMEEAEKEESKMRWKVVVDFLSGVLINGLP